MELYDMAKRYYRKISEMECQSGVSESARKSVDACKKNIANCEENKKRMAEGEAIEQFNQATRRFNEGGNLIKQSQWDEAKAALEEAAEIWNRIASGETDIGKKAKPLAEKAEELSEELAKKAASSKYDD